MNEIVKSLAAESHRRIEIRENDYKVGGIWYCGICHTPKQFVRQVGELHIDAMCLCECQKEAYEREEAAFAREEKEKEIARRRRECFPVPGMDEWTFANDDHAKPGASAACKRYCDEFSGALRDGTGLLLYGEVGTGKSFLAACIANRLLDDGYRVVFDNARGYADMAFDDKEYFTDAITSADLVVLDDLGMERATEYMKETVFQILDKRCQSGKPLIVTTNLSNEALKAPRGVDEERVYSRLLEKSVPILMKGEDRRREKGRITAKEWREILLG